MASASTALRLCARAIARPQPASTFRRTRPLLARRTITTTPLRWRPSKTPEDGDQADEASDYNFVESMLEDVPPEQRTPDMVAELQKLEAQLADQEKQMHKGLDEQSATLFKEPRPQRDSFWFDEEDDDPATHDIVGEDFDEDDIPTMAHGKLDEVREMRHYARVTAWEMPLLASTFIPPSPGIPARGAGPATSRIL